MQVILISILTVAFMISAATGIGKGILYLSLTNMVIAVILLFFILFAGPTVFLLNTFTQSIGQYLGSFANMSFRAGAFTDSEWRPELDAVLLGVVDLLGTVCRDVYRPVSPGGRTIREFVFGCASSPR